MSEELHLKREPKKIYLATAKPEDFMDIQILDWIQYVGDVTTEYEAKFLRNFGGFLCASHSAIQQPGQQEEGK